MDSSLELVKQLEPTIEPPTDAARAEQRALLERLMVTAGSAPITRPRVRSHRAGTIVGAVGVALALVGGGMAAAAALASSPTPHQAAVIYEHGYPNHGAQRTPGSRPTLNAEMVLCDYASLTSLPTSVRDGVPGEGFASAAALTTPLTADMLSAACDHVATTGATVPAGTPATLCVTGAPSAQTGTPAGWPIVALGGGSCATAGVNEAPANLIDQVNQRRNTEAAIDAVPQPCPTESQAVTWVRQQLSALKVDMQVSAWNNGSAGSCYTPSVQWWQPDSTLPMVEVTASQELGAAPGSSSSPTTTTVAP